ncbi:MAG: transposase [Gammaproteobacteria bacterium]|jgi:transposase
MTNKIRKPRENFTPDQRLEYAKLMVEERYSNQQVMDISGEHYHRHPLK